MIPLQTTEGIQHLLDFEFMKAFATPYTSVLGLGVVGMIVFGGVALAIYISTGDIRMPAVLTLLTGGVVIPLVASPAVSIVVIMLVVLGGGAFAYLAAQYK